MRHIFLAIFLNLVCVPIVLSDVQSVSLGNDQKINRRVALSQLEYEADRLVEEGLYDQALSKYEMILTSSLIRSEQDRWYAEQGIAICRRFKGEYEHALAIFKKLRDKVTLQGVPQVDYMQLKVLETEALIQARDGNIQAINDFLRRREGMVGKLYFKGRFLSHAQKRHFEKSLYLYEIIQDYDSALKLCDEYLAMKKVKKDKKFKAEVEDLRQTILEARETKEKNKIFKKLNEYGFYNWL